MASKPCGCGDPMSGAKIYMKRPLKVYAQQMRRDFIINTPEGIMRGKPDDYLVMGVKGERYIVARKIFEETYDLDPASTEYNALPVKIETDG